MNKIINKIKEHDILFVFITTIIITLISMANARMNIGDELWEFSNIYKMCNGFVIYKDLNVIQTPLYFYFGKIFLQLFGTNYFVYRIYDRVIIKIILYLSIYVLFRKLKISKKNSILYYFIIIITFQFKIDNSTYNILAIQYIIWGIINEKSKIKLYLKDIIQGIIIFLIFCSKQNIGVYYMIGFVLYNILKEGNIKQKVISMVRTFSTAFTCLIILILKLNINGNLHGFLDYTFYGMKEFAIKNIFSDYLNVFQVMFEFVIELMSFIFIYNKRTKNKIDIEERNNIKLLVSINLIENLSVIPIVNSAHTEYLNLLFSITILYIFDVILFRNILSFKTSKYIKRALIWLNVLIIIYFIIMETLYIKQLKNQKKYFSIGEPYFGAIDKDNISDNIDEITNYIYMQRDNGYDVKIISYYADLYNVILKENNKNMDLPFYGNLGSKGEAGLIEEVKELKNTKVLVLTQEDDKYQESSDTMEYIKSNLEYEGQIENFSIYYKN